MLPDPVAVASGLPSPDALGWAVHRPWPAVVAAVAVLAAVAARRQVQHARHARLARGARQLRIVTAPQVEAAGAAQFWSTVAGALHRGGWRRWCYGAAHVAFEYRWAGRSLTISVWVPGEAADAVATAARAAWPGAAVQAGPADDPVPPTPVAAAGGALLPARAEAYPLRAGHDADPLRQILAAGAGLHDSEHACIQVLARPAAPRRVARLRRAPSALRDPQPASPLGTLMGGLASELLDLMSPGPGRGRPAQASSRPDPVSDREIRAVADKGADGPHWQVAIRYAVTDSSRRAGAAQPGRLGAVGAGIAAAFAVYTGVNRLRRVAVARPGAVLAGRRLRGGFLLSTPELAAIAALPTDLAVPGLARAQAKPVAAPVEVRSGGRHTVALGRAQVGGHKVALGVADGRQHLHVMGPTGTGKSTLLLNLALGHIRAGRGVVVIDPRGDLVTDILDRLPFDAAQKVVLLDPAQEPPPAFNPLQGDDDDLVVDNIVSIFGKIFARHWGPRIDDTLRSALLTLMTKANPMLTMVPPLLNDRQLRAELTADLHDPAGLGGFWTWYDRLPENIRAQVIGPVLARLRAMLTRRFVRRVVGQPRSSFDMGAVLDGGILLCRLPKGVLGADTSRLLGSFVVASAWQAATARASRPEQSRPDAVLLIDECHNFLNLAHSVDEMCAEARGYHLSLVLAHQDLSQLPRETEAAIAANCRSKIWFTCSANDAQRLARHVRPELDEHDLAHLPRYTAAARLVVDGATTAAFTLRTDPPPAPVGKADLIRAECARRTAALLPQEQPANARRAGLPDVTAAPPARRARRPREGRQPG